MWQTMTGVLLKGTGETLEMVVVACFFAVLLGLPLGVLLFVTQRQQVLASPTFNRLLGVVVNVVRSVPFIILMVAIIPLTRWVVGTSIGTGAAIVPLAIAAIPFFARLVEAALAEVPQGLVETGHAMGGSPFAIVWSVLLPESRQGVVRAVTLTLITLVGYSAMAGAVGGGGLGDIAIQYGYNRFNSAMMLTTVLILVVLVQCLQWLGDWVVRRLPQTSL